MVYVLKGWIKTSPMGQGEIVMRRALLDPAALIEHLVLDYSTTARCSRFPPRTSSRGAE